MATYYWVGGAGTWDATTTTNWATSSGGAGGAGVPTSADNAIFDSLSNATAYAVTVGTNAVAADITIAGPAAGDVTITSGATAAINCYGNWTNAATGVVFTTTTGAVLTFSAIVAGNIVTTNNVTFGAMTVTFNSSPGEWTLGSAITTTGAINVSAGTFNTGANYAVNAASFASSNSNFKSITLNSSVITTTATGGFQLAVSATNLTFSGASSTINLFNNSSTFGGISGLTYGTVQFTGFTAGAHIINGANTYTDLTFTSRTTDGIGLISFGGDQVVSGTLTLGTANTAVRRLFAFSSVVGTPRTLTVQTLATLSDVDFKDIVAAGASASSPWTGTRLGNCLNNSNITFAAGTTKYFRSVSGASANWGGVVWSTSSLDTATPAVTDFPLAQDTCVVDDAGSVVNNGLRTGNTITLGASWNIGTISFGGRTTAFNWVQGNFDPIIYGNVTLTSAMTMTTVTGSPTWMFSGQGVTQTIDTAGITLRLAQFNVFSPNGTVSLASDITSELVAGTTGLTQLEFGTLALNSFTFTTTTFSSTNSNIRAINFGTTGKIVVTTTATSTAWTTSTSTNLTLSGSKDVELTGNALLGVTRTISSPIVGISGTEATALNFYINAGADIISLGIVPRAFNTISFNNAFTGSTTLNATPVIYGNLVLSTGMSIPSSSVPWTFAATSAGKTITTNGVVLPIPITFDGVGGVWAMQDALTMSGTRELTLTNGTLQLKSGTTNTVGSLVTTGTTQKFLQSTTPGTQATISDASGTNSVSYLTIQDSNATGGATWYALAPSVDAGNNTGWFFIPTPADSNEITMRLRSFTQPRRF